MNIAFCCEIRMNILQNVRYAHSLVIIQNKLLQLVFFLLTYYPIQISCIETVAPVVSVGVLNVFNILQRGISYVRTNEGHAIVDGRKSQVSRAGRKSLIGVGIGREYVSNMTANTWRTPLILAFTNQLAPGPI